MSDVSGNLNLNDQLVQLITDSITRQPGTGAEAAALLSYILERDVAPLIAKLKTWAIATLTSEEKALAVKAWAEVAVIESSVSGWCTPSAKTK